MSKKRKYRKIIIACVVIVLCTVLPIVYYNITNDSIKSLVFGVLSSIIASLIFYLFSEAVFDDKTAAIDELRNLTDTLVELQTKGILSIRGRNEFEQEFWISLLLETNNKLILSGRTLNRWLEGAMQVPFEKNLKRIIQNKGTVTLIIYKDLPNKEEQDEKKILREFLENAIFPICVQWSTKSKRYKRKEKIKLRIYEVDILPYLYTSNENRIIIAPYFKHVDNSNNIMFSLKRDCKYGTEYVRDFEKIIQNAQENDWLSEYIKRKNDEKGVESSAPSKSVKKEKQGGGRE